VNLSRQLFAPPRFCPFCGDPLVIYEREYGFDSQTGRQRMERRADCPRTLDGTATGTHPTRPNPTRGGLLGHSA
jgi:hypothetical protein